MTVKPIEQENSSGGAGALVLGMLVLGGVVAVAVFAIQALPALHNPLPRRDGHYTDWKRVTQADNARAIIGDPRSDCEFHSCQTTSGSKLRVCKGNLEGKVVWAVQWVTEKVSGGWAEGTSFIQKRKNKLNNYLRANGCDGL